MTMSHPQSYEILLVPAFTDTKGSDAKGSGPGTGGPGNTIRSAIVDATGETGESGYPRYSGDGMVADIDPSTHTVEALLVDGSELDYGLSVRIAQKRGAQSGAQDNGAQENAEG
ncbi:hypothetical protein [Streptomyces laculatispora]|uniref:hypothetical protein n=1 Tax=Streptomyces laculatispora TaxID=887464 RepID=UPI001A940D58|nr:hypothetical protein [Streptomyces laculatispora]